MQTIITKPAGAVRSYYFTVPTSGGIVVRFPTPTRRLVIHNDTGSTDLALDFEGKPPTIPSAATGNPVMTSTYVKSGDGGWSGDVACQALGLIAYGATATVRVDAYFTLEAAPAQPLTTPINPTE